MGACLACGRGNVPQRLCDECARGVLRGMAASLVQRQRLIAGLSPWLRWWRARENIAPTVQTQLALFRAFRTLSLLFAIGMLFPVAMVFSQWAQLARWMQMSDTLVVAGLFVGVIVGTVTGLLIGRRLTRSLVQVWIELPDRMPWPLRRTIRSAFGRVLLDPSHWFLTLAPVVVAVWLIALMRLPRDSRLLVPGLLAGLLGLNTVLGALVGVCAGFFRDGDWIDACTRLQSRGCV